jgi:site-specific DNA-methyltransferase (adenine-specific)
MMGNTLYYGDNLEVLRKKITTSTIDLCYIDPPFNSKRTYNQIYNNMGTEDRAQAQAFIDTWIWDDIAIEGYQEILDNNGNRFTKQTIELIKGLTNVLGKDSLLAYLISMTLRITEIQRVLKPTGSFYLHCDPTASHYLKLVIDSIFVPNGGQIRNEIIWHYLKWSIEQRQFVHNHDDIFFYSKSDDKSRVFKTLFVERSPATKKRFGNAKIISSHDSTGNRQPSETTGEDSIGVAMDDVWDISRVPPIKQLYPTEKPSLLLERIIKSSSNEGDLVLDAYCGCGTTIAVSQEFNRKWIGIDITYQSIAVILKRLEEQFGKSVLNQITLDGIPRDMKSAIALANKKDDRVRKEFEKWAVMTYTSNRAIINQKKGADSGIDGIAYFRTNNTDNAKIIIQVKSGGVKRNDIATLRGDRQRESAAMAVLITLESPTSPMIKEAKDAGHYHHDLMNRDYDAIQIVTIQDMIENGKVLDIPMSLDVLKAAELKASGNQLTLLDT